MIDQVIESALLVLAQGKRKERVRLAELRARLPLHSRESLYAALVRMQRAGTIVLYREDNTPALTHEDHDAAIMVGDCPRHLALLL